MSTSPEVKPYDERMAKTIAALQSDLAGIRASSANPAVLDKLSVDYYGTPTKINQVAAVSVAEARILTISPYDKSLLKPIEKAIQQSDIGINPQNDGSLIRLIFPQLTGERRAELSKQISKHAEECKVAVRNVRRDALEKFKSMKKSGSLTEDDQKLLESETQKLTDKYVENIETICKKKQEEIMEV